MLYTYCTQIRSQEISGSLDESNFESLRTIASLPNEEFYNQPEALQALIECSRKPQWRDSFRESGVLQKMIGLLSPTEEGTAVQLRILSFIGNCCADNNKNRAMLLAQFGRLILMIRHPLFSGRAVFVAYNFCNDWSPGKEEVAKTGILSDLVTLLSHDRFMSDETHSYCASELLLMTVQYLKDQGTVKSLDLNLLQAIIMLSMRNSSSEAQIAVSEASFEILHSSELYDDLAQPQIMILILSWLETSAKLTTQGNAVIEEFDNNSGHSSSNEPNHSIAMKLLLFLSDISASGAFLSCNPLDGHVISKLMEWLRNGSAILAKCACLMLGNSARLNDRCEAMLLKPVSVPEMKPLSQCLSNIIEQGKDQSLIHAALGLTGNLLQPISNKNYLGSLGFVEKVYSVISAQAVTQNINIAALRVLRLLVKDSWQNTKRLFEPPKANNSSNSLDLAKTGPTATSSEDSTIFLIITTQLWNTEDIQVLVEVGRLIISVYRNFYSLQVCPEESEPIIRSILQDDIAAKYFSFMLQQEKMKNIRSEAFFGAALVTRSREGAIYFTQALSDDLVKVLEHAFENVSLGNGLDALNNHDKENAMVLVSGLLRVLDHETNGQYCSRLRNMMKLYEVEC